jgi:hypothetical protein
MENSARVGPRINYPVNGALNWAKGYSSGMDQFDRRRVLDLRQEIASLRRDNESYRSRAHHAPSEANTSELRRLRLLAIREELLRLNDANRKSNAANRSR